ncbi:ABC transporter permease [Niameybacter massiliensis]|uniref:ABC transporter permease n=1 Tax=Holtiella tumoricola TaxID=3018743 RepID=A0AA42DND3_9FIRM|nr:ABC transporter permease [Holtiella tumoricola]MDA3731985.1 ABC transporter permease [Holtiella tumoricola]
MGIESFLIAAVIAGTPLLLATLGGVMSEKVGHINLGVEGMMVMGAVVGFNVGVTTQNAWLALLGAMLAGGFGALIYAVLTVSLRANQVVTGLTLTIFGTGFANFLGQNLVGQIVPEPVKAVLAPKAIPLLSEIPIIGAAFFNQSIFIYLAYIIAIILFVYYKYTKVGLNARMIGESPAAADAVGIRVELYKYLNLVIGGMLCGLSGAFLSLVYVPAWQQNITAGRGWIAVALVIFIGWHPLKAIFGAILFGALDILGLRLQAAGIQINQYFVDMLPYVVTILFLVIGSIRSGGQNLGPKALGENYFREER